MKSCSWYWTCCVRTAQQSGYKDICVNDGIVQVIHLPSFYSIGLIENKAELFKKQLTNGDV